MPTGWKLVRTVIPRWIDSTATSSWTDIYVATTAASSASTWITAPTFWSTTPTTATAYTHYRTMVDAWRSDVDDALYWHLARSRVAISAERRAEIARTNEARRRREAELYEQQQRDMRLARDRSRELLLAHLSDRQRQMFETMGWFIVHGGRSDTKYRIRTDRISANIEVFEGDRITHRLCGHLRHDLPHFDHILAQKVSLELDEDRFVGLCNRHAA